MKQIVNRFGKKALSAVLALAVILCSITATLSVFAQAGEATYEISYGSPLIPMFKDKALSLNDVSLQMEKDAAAVEGKYIGWSYSGSSNGLILNGKQVLAVETGIYKLTATYKGTEKNVYVIVNNEGDYNFNLVDLDFSRASDFNAEDWCLAGSKTDKVFNNEYIYYKDYTVSRHDGGFLQLDFNWSASPYNGYSLFLYNNEILNDFADYTLNTTATMHQGSVGDVGWLSVYGILTRANVNAYTADGNAFSESGNGLALSSRLFGGVNVAVLGKGNLAANGDTGNVKASLFTGADLYNDITNMENPVLDKVFATQNIVYKVGTDESNTDTYGKTYAEITDNANIGKIRNVEVVLNGDDVKYSIDSNVILDTAANDTYTTTSEITAPKDFVTNGTYKYDEKAYTYKSFTQPQAFSNYNSLIKAADVYHGGSIGFFCDMTNIRLYKMNVKANLKTDADGNFVMPAMTDFVTVNNASPAVPMFVNTTADFSNMLVQLSENGAYYSAAALTWEMDSSNTNNGIFVIDNDADKFSAYATGVFTLKATNAATGESSRIYVIVNEKDNYEFNIVDLNLRNATANYNANDWYYNQKGLNDISSSTYTSKTTVNKDGTDGVTFAHNWHNSAVFMYKSEILKDFADYTIKTTVKDNTNESGLNGFTAFEVVARAQLDETADGPVFKSGFVPVVLGTRQYGGVRVQKITDRTVDFINGNTTLHNVEDSSLVTYTTSDTSYIWGQNMLYASTQKERDVQVQLSGDRIVYSLDGNTIFDSDKSIKTMSFGVGVTATNNPYTESTTTNAAFDTFMSDVSKKGTVGFVLNRVGVKIYSLKVSINGVSADKMLPYTDAPALYTVDDATPYIPMNAGYKVDTANFLIKLGGKSYQGKEITFTSTDDGITVNGDEIIANKKGVYTLSAVLKSDDTVTGKMYVIVKNPSDTEYVAYENDFRSLYESDGNGGYKKRTYENDWQTTVFWGSKTQTVKSYVGDGYTEDWSGATNYADTMGYNGFMPFTTAAVREAATAADKSLDVGTNMYGYTLLQDDFVSSLSDYKITATFKERKGTRAYIGLIGRATGYDADYNLLTDSTPTLDGFIVSGTASYFAGGNNEAGLRTTGFLSVPQKRADADEYAHTSSPWYNNIWTDSDWASYSHKTRQYTLEFNGDTMSYSTPAIADANTASSAQKAGAVGFVLYDATEFSGIAAVSVLDFKVTLTNVNDSALPMQKVADVTEEAKADNYLEIDGTYDYTVDDSLGRISKITVKDAVQDTDGNYVYGNKLTVPAQVNGTDITSIGHTGTSTAWGQYDTARSLTDDNTNKYLSYIDLSKTSITKIRNDAFYRNLESTSKAVYPENLETVVLPDTVRTVDSSGAFKNAISLTSFKAPANLQSVSAWMFENCASLNKVELNDGLEFISYYAFRACSNLGEITIPDSVTHIDGGAFQKCTSLHTVKLGNSLENIDSFVFDGCTMLKTIEIPKSVKSISSSVFPSSLESIYIYSANCTIASGTIKANTVIYGYKGSTAQAYAETNGNTFIAIDDIDGATIAANSKFDLAATQIAVGTENVKGSDIAWDALRSDVCEIANNYLLAYAPGTVTVTGNYNGTAVSINVTVTERGTQSSVATTSIADDRVSITPLADGKYRFTVDDNVAYVPASLTVSENGEEITSITAYGITGRAYDAELFDVSAMYATAAFEDTAETVERSVYMRGATVKVADSATGVLAGIKFVTAVPQIKYNSTSGTIDLNGADITLADGTVVNFTDVGALIIPEALTGGTQLTIPEDFDVTSTTLKVGKYNAVNVPISTVNSTYESYSQISAVLNNIPDNMQDTRITSVTYLKYIEKNTGKVGFIYSDEKTISYDEVMAIADPYPTFKNGKYQDVISGGPVNELDNNASTDSISYGLNEDITFKYKVKGLYNVKYELYKDLPSENLYGTETYTTGTTKVLEGVCTDRVFTLTTQMKKAGTLRLRIFLLDAKGNAVTLPGNTTFFDTVVAADYANITEVMAEKGLVDYSQTEKVYDEMKTAFAAKSDVLKNAVAADRTNFDAFFDKLNTNPVLGDTYENGNLIYLSVVNITDNDVFLDFRLATDSVVGTTSTGSNNLFSDEVYKTQAEATNTQEYNLRPSTGVIVLPRNAADNSLSLSGGYQGYGESYGGITASANGVLAIRMNSHGFKNYEAAINTTYRDNMKSTNIENGGINGCIVGSYEAGMTDYKDMYQYGMLMRDYVALQFAKLFPAYNKAGGNVSTSGGSMGGWQSVSIAALDNDVTNASLSIVWMCSVGGNEYEYVPSNFMPTIVNGNTTRMLYSSVGAADYINKTLSQRAGFKVKVYGGLADPTAPVQGLIALYNKFECEKSLELIQFMKHGENYSSKLYRNERSAAAK